MRAGQRWTCSPPPVTAWAAAGSVPDAVGLGDLILWGFSALGAVTAAIQIWKWIAGRRAERGLQRFLERYADEAEADLARTDLTVLRTAVAELQEAAPRLARRLHLEQRRQELVSAVGRDVAEYARLSAELSAAGISAKLSPTAAAVLQAEIQPAFTRKQRERRRLLILLSVLVASALLPPPFTPRDMLSDLLGALEAVFWNPPRLGDKSMFFPVLVGSLGCLFGYRLAPRLQGHISSLAAKGAMLRMVGAVAVTLGLAAAAVSASVAYAESGYDTRAGSVSGAMNAACLGFFLVGGTLLRLSSADHLGHRPSSARAGRVRRTLIRPR